MNKNMPRKSSTNLRSLSNRINNIQREMNPQLTCNGSMLLTATTTNNSRATYVDRSYTVLGTIPTGATTVTLTDNDFTTVPLGSKILSFRARNLTSRTLRILIGPNSKIWDQGSAALNQVDRFIAAPYSRFPTLRVNIPDLLANGDFFNQSASNEFATFYGNASDVIEVKIHVKVPVV
jgi:hypothetical protein